MTGGDRSFRSHELETSGEGQIGEGLPTFPHLILQGPRVTGKVCHNPQLSAGLVYLAKMPLGQIACTPTFPSTNCVMSTSTATLVSM